MKCAKRKYADGGKVVEREYGKPTFMKSVAAKAGIGDGYSYRPKKSEPKKAASPRKMDVSNATVEFGNVVAKRKKMLDET